MLQMTKVALKGRASRPSTHTALLEAEFRADESSKTTNGVNAALNLKRNKIAHADSRESTAGALR